MKKILLALFILIGFSVSGQVLQTPTVYGYAFRRVGGDTLLFIPGDTLQVPATYNSKTFVARKGTTLYYWNGTKWTAISGAGGGSTDTTSLSNRINLKLNISDTAAMLANYRKVDSIWRVAGKDSIFWLKNGTTYKFKDSINPYKRFALGGEDNDITGQNRSIDGGYTGSMSWDFLNSVNFIVDNNTSAQQRFRMSYTAPGGLVDSAVVWEMSSTGSGSGAAATNRREVGVFINHIGIRDSLPQVVLHSGSIPNQLSKGSLGSGTSVVVQPQLLRFNFDANNPNWKLVGLPTTTDTTWKPLGFRASDSSVRVVTNWPGGGTTYTAGNGLTLSGSEFRLGGVLSANTMIGGGGGARWIMFDTVANFQGVVRNGSNYSNVGIFQDDASLNYYASTDRQNVIQATNIGSYLGSGTTSTRFALVSTIRSDSSVRLRSLSKKFFIDTLQSGGGETMVYNRATNAVSFRIDTLTLAGFGAGSGAAGDTAAFTTDALYGSLYIDVDTFVVTKIVAVIQAGATDTLGIQIYYNDSLNTGTTGVATSTLALTSRPQGHSTTTLSNATIPPGSFIWCKSPTVVAGRKPEYLSVSLIGYRKRRI